MFGIARRVYEFIAWSSVMTTMTFGRSGPSDSPHPASASSREETRHERH